METVRASRLLSVLLLLQNRGRMTARELADELEVSVRTVYRDVEALSAAGVPVYADRGRTGAYQLLGGYRTRLTGLSEEEAQALALAGLPVAATELGLGTVLAAAQLKLHAALPEELRRRASELAERFHVDVPGWHRDIERASALAGVADAVWHARRVRVRYRRWDGSAVDRELDPLGLVLKAGVWYLAARCDGSVRTYRVSRVDALTDLGETFDRPGDFELAEYWRAWSEGFERRLYPETARVRLSPLGRELVPFFLGAVGARALRDAGTRPAPDGWSTVELPVEAGAPALGQLLRFGAELEVLAPPELRHRVSEAVTRMGELYG
ncbi:putative transcriptional regulator [Saccharomonospora cyanea NA-134]|uniref:Putative transcriptional regulator n=1 Tax=Saccharomonospora cyanea NA-134 TaxID=882082 RepID=H5XJH0_9PSEU|nr:WYL domain-containing protein [Saccharomonospora cyanea]EHR59720.1 putative transcriptional regulator [Saccharomonospora cyanea NA-134]